MHTANELMFLKFLWCNAQWWFVEPKHVALMTCIKEMCLTAILHLYSTQQNAWISQLVIYFYTPVPTKIIINFYSETLRTVGLLHYDVVNMPTISGMPSPVQHLCWDFMFYNKNPSFVMVMHKKTYLQKLWCGVV
jgi:hypothetical protein